MFKHYPLKTHTYTAASVLIKLSLATIINVCLIPAVFAEDTSSTAPQQTTTTTATTTEITEAVVEEDGSPTDNTVDKNTTVITPQPPLIEPSTEKHYEPKLDNTTDVTKKTPETTQQVSQPSKENNEDPAISRSIDDTPQPPLIDVQQEPSYGPDEETEKDITTIEPPPEKESLSETQNYTDDTISKPATILNPESTTSESELATEKNEEEQSSSWTDTRPKRVNADWLQLTSGEWLRGRIIIMQKEKLEFDSDELNNLEIDWHKVKYIKSYKPYNLRFDGRIQATGAIEITLDAVHVESDYDDLTFSRSSLLNIASGQETEISKWTNKVTFSFNIRRGNTNQTDFTSKISAKRRTINSRLLLDYLGNFTEIENNETINNHRINATFDAFITRQLFVTPITVELFRDPFQNIEHRINIGIAIGYTLINTNETEWDISGGPSRQETQFVSVQAGESTNDSTATLVLSTKFDTELNDKVDLEGTYSVTLGDDKTGNYTHHSILTIETEITDKLDFDVSGVWDRVQQPVQAEDGSFPEQDDFRILIGLGYDL